jgi:pyridoxamine 5'-phosphate oxidase
MGQFVSLVAEKEEPVCTDSQYRWHHYPQWDYIIALSPKPKPSDILGCALWLLVDTRSGSVIELVSRQGGLMTKSEILALINANPACHLATVEGDAPHVRGILLYGADDSGLVFHTGKTKDLHRQLTRNPKVEICFNDFQKGIQVRVSGSVELVDDIALKKEIVAKRDFLKPWVEQQGWDLLVVYRLRRGKATTWTMQTNFDPKTYVDL